MRWGTACWRSIVGVCRSLACVRTAAGILLVSVASATGTTFSDTEFQLEDWDCTYHTHGAGGTLNFAHEPSGGNPNGHLRIGLDLYESPPDLGSGICVRVQDVSTLFVPPQQEEVRVDFSIDYSWNIQGRRTPFSIAELGMRFQVGCTTDVETTLAASPLAPTGEGWRTLHATFVIDGSPVGFPGTFQNGLWGVAPLEFAFALSHFAAADGSGLVSELRLDNWQVNVTAIPEPPMGILLAAGARLVLRRSSRPSFCAEKKL